MKFERLPSLTLFRSCGILAGLAGFASVLPAATLFEQDFNSSNTVSDYVTGGGASGSLFTDISGPATMTQSITNGALVLSNVSGSNNDSQGFRYSGGFAGGTPGFLMVDYDFELNTTANSSGQALFIFGNSTEVNRGYGATGNLANNSFGYISVKGGNTAGEIQITVNTTWGGAAPSTLEPTGMFSLRLYLNDTGSDVVYTGLDGSGYTANNDSISLWYSDGGSWTPYILNEDAFAGSGDLYGFRFVQEYVADSATIDNLAIYDSAVIPESSQAALAFGGLVLALAMMRRRRR